MSRLYKIAFILIIAFTAFNGAIAQSSGQEYLLCFPGGGLDSAQFQKYPDSGSCIYISSYNNTTNITITCKAYPDYKKNFTLPPYTPLRYKIWKDFLPEILTSEQIDNKAILISVDYPILCVIQQLTDGGITDAALTYPKSRYSGKEYGEEYRVISYPADKDFRDPMYKGLPSDVVFGAFEDSTKVSVIVSTLTNHGDSANSVLNYILNRGECVQIYSAYAKYKINYDITSTIIQSNKPISVYSACEASVPSSQALAAGDDAFDEGILLEAVPQLNTWGKTFLLRKHEPLLPARYPGDPGGNPNPDSMYDVVRVLADLSNTKINVNGVQWVMLDAGQYRDTDIRGVFAIQSSNPICVAQYDRSQLFGGGDTNLPGTGPDMAIVPPLEQRSSDFRFFSMHDLEDSYYYYGHYIDHYIMISGDESIKNTITLDGSLLPDTGFVDVPTSLNGENLVIGSYRIDSGFHHISTTSLKGMTLLVYGGGDGFGYAYGMGSLNSQQSGVASIQPIVTSLKVSPNPVTSFADFQFTPLKESVSLEIYDMLGRPILIKQLLPGEGSFQLSMQNYPQGIYIARLGLEIAQFVKI